MPEPRVHHDCRKCILFSRKNIAGDCANLDLCVELILYEQSAGGEVSGTSGFAAKKK